MPTTAAAIAIAIPATAAAGPPAHHGYYRTVRQPGAFTAAAPPKVITYGALTSQDSPLVVQLSRTATSVSRVAVHWEAPCSSGMSVLFGDTLVAKPGTPPGTIPDGSHFFSASRVSGGRFSGTAVGSLDFGAYQGAVSQAIKGTVGAKRGSGALQAHVDVFERATGNKVDECDTGSLKWVAAGPQELVYGGSTSIGEPVVLSLDKRRKKVKEIGFGWSAGCTPSGFVSYGDALTNFPLSRTGGWGDTFTQNFPLPDGNTNEFAYTIKGKVSAKTATGSFQVTRILRDAVGTAVETCATPTIRFSARQ
jgi:hypothetical protein